MNDSVSENDHIDFIERVSISMNDILRALNKFKFNKSQGPTPIPNLVLKNCVNGITKLLFVLYNSIIMHNEIPSQMKIASVSPIPKAGKNKTLISSYRGVSVQPNIVRLFDTIVLNQIMPFINVNKLIPLNQYAYRRGMSSFHQHIDVQNLIFKSLNDVNVIAIEMIFLDFSNAFDTIPFNKLLHKLHSMGFRGDIFKLIESSFSNRKQFVKFKGVKSDTISVCSGVSQGGVCSPVYFNLYVSDLSQNLNCDVFQFADDVLLMKVIHSRAENLNPNPIYDGNGSGIGMGLGFKF